MGQVVSGTLTPSTAQSEFVFKPPSVIVQETTSSWSFTLQQVGGGAIANTQLTAATLTLLAPDGTVINSRQNQDILGAPANTGANNVIISATSDFTWDMQTNDNVIVDPGKANEVHYAGFDLRYDLGAGVQVVFQTVQLKVNRRFGLLQLVS